MNIIFFRYFPLLIWRLATIFFFHTTQVIVILQLNIIITKQFPLDLHLWLSLDWIPTTWPLKKYPPSNFYINVNLESPMVMHELAALLSYLPWRHSSVFPSLARKNARQSLLLPHGWEIMSFTNCVQIYPILYLRDILLHRDLRWVQPFGVYHALPAQMFPGNLLK